MSQPPPVKSQLNNLKRIISSYPTSSADHAAWARAKSRSSFRPSSPFPPLPAIPISGRSAAVQLYWREFDWNREAPARLLPGLQRILEQSKGNLKRFCLYSIQYFRIKHSRSFRPGASLVPPFSDLERSLLPSAFLASLDRRPELFSAAQHPKVCSAFDSIKIKKKLEAAFPEEFSKEVDLTLLNQGPTSEENSRTYINTVDPLSPSPTGVNQNNSAPLEAVPQPPVTDLKSEGSDSDSPDPSVDEFAYVESLPRPSATDGRHSAGKRRSIRTARFNSSDYVF